MYFETLDGISILNATAEVLTVLYEGLMSSIRLDLWVNIVNPADSRPLGRFFPPRNVGRCGKLVAEH